MSHTAVSHLSLIDDCTVLFADIRLTVALMLQCCVRRRRRLSSSVRTVLWLNGAS